MTRFCPRCAATVDVPPPSTCDSCGYEQYVNARPTGSVILLDDGGDRFLAIRRARAPHRGEWALPGGFCDGWEHPADAAAREAREEVGAHVTLGRFVGMYVGEYEYQSERFPVLDCFYFATADGPLAANPAEVSEMEWFAVSNPPRLGFATMRSAMSDAKQLISG